MLVKGLYLYGTVNERFTDIIHQLLGVFFAMRLDINNKVSVISIFKLLILLMVN